MLKSGNSEVIMFASVCVKLQKAKKSKYLVLLKLVIASLSFFFFLLSSLAFLAKLFCVI